MTCGNEVVWRIDGVRHDGPPLDGNGIVTVEVAGVETYVVGRVTDGRLEPVHSMPLVRLAWPYTLHHPLYGDVEIRDPVLVWWWLEEHMLPFPFVLYGRDGGAFGHLYLEKGVRFACLRDENGLANLLRSQSEMA